MITRRTLFTRLSAIALAPLAKWLPKEEAYQWCKATFVAQPPGIIVWHNGRWWLMSVPQEEA